jgi:uncharacterized delta-60 repeat protein
MRVRVLLLLTVPLSALVLANCIGDPTNVDGGVIDSGIPDGTTGTDGSMSDSNSGMDGMMSMDAGGCVTDSGAKAGSVDMTGFANGIKNLLDPTFEPAALAVDSMSRIWVAGLATCNSSSNRMAVFRFQADGTVDPSFAKPMCLDFGNDSTRRSYANAITIDSAGKVIVAGGESTGNGIGSTHRPAMVKISGNTLDGSFGQGGKILGTTLGPIRSVTTDGEQPIIAGAVSAGFLPAGGYVQRLQKDGSLDNSFNSGGAAVQADRFDGGNGGTSALQYETVAVDANHGIFVAGTSVSPANYLVRHFKQDGSIDMAFNGGNAVITSLTNQDDYALALGVSNGARVAGTASTGTGLTGYNASGLDIGFGSSGMVMIPENQDNRSRGILTVQCDGKLVVTGYNGTNNMTLSRLTSTGTFDSTFGNNGIATLTLMGSSEVDIALRTDPITGKIIVLGRSVDAGNGGRIVLVRVNQ